MAHGEEHLEIIRKAIQPTTEEILTPTEGKMREYEKFLANELQYGILRDMERDITLTRDQLVKRMQNLAEDLTRTAKNLRGHDILKANYCGINSLGEVQGKGSDIDRLCGELSVLKDNYQKIMSMNTRLKRGATN